MKDITPENADQFIGLIEEVYNEWHFFLPGHKDTWGKIKKAAQENDPFEASEIIENLIWRSKDFIVEGLMEIFSHPGWTWTIEEELAIRLSSANQFPHKYQFNIHNFYHDKIPIFTVDSLQGIMGINKTSISEKLHSLMEKGYATRKRIPEDNYKYYYAITDSGYEYAKTLLEEKRQPITTEPAVKI